MKNALPDANMKRVLSAMPQTCSSRAGPLPSSLRHRPAKPQAHASLVCVNTVSLDPFATSFLFQVKKKEGWGEGGGGGVI